MHRFYMGRFGLKKLNKVQVKKEEYRLEISNRLAALEVLDAEVDINRAWETITENIKNQQKRAKVIIN
jgi:hypothetical protein